MLILCRIAWACVSVRKLVNSHFAVDIIVIINVLDAVPSTIHEDFDKN